MELEERLRRAGGSAEELATILFDRSEEVLLALLDNPRLNEDHLKVLLARKELRQGLLRELAARERLIRPYPVKVALVRHPHTPRSIALTLLRYLYTFDLVRVATTPSAGPEIRRVAEEAVVARLEGLSLGERLSLARQGTTRIAAALLGDPDPGVFRTALENPRLTAEWVVRTLREDRLGPGPVEAIGLHPHWSTLYEVRLALIRHPATSLRRMLELVEQVRRGDLADITADQRLPRERRQYLAHLLEVHHARARRPRGRAAEIAEDSDTVEDGS